MQTVTIRPAADRDAASVAGIYAPYVEHTAISFEEQAPSPGEMAARIAKCRPRWPWLAAELDGAVVGFAYGSQHRERAALPNDPSVKLHTSMGFEPIGTFRSIGWKFGRWHDVAWFQRTLRNGPPVE